MSSDCSVRATEAASALRIAAQDFQGFLLHQPRVAIEMLRGMVLRLREVQERVDAWAGLG